MNDDEITEFVKNGDCPAQLLDLLDAEKNVWRKGIIKEFISDHLWKRKIESKLKRLSTENKLVITLLSALVGIALKIAFFGA